MNALFDEYPLLLLGLEAALALFLLLFIVFWTTRGVRDIPSTRRLHQKDQCKTRGIDKINGGMGASKRVPSSATQK